MNGWDLVLKPENLEKLKAAASLSLMRLKKFLLTVSTNYLGKDPNTWQADDLLRPGNRSVVEATAKHSLFPLLAIH